jgi:hypothetical protein
MDGLKVDWNSTPRWRGILGAIAVIEPCGRKPVRYCVIKGRNSVARERWLAIVLRDAELVREVVVVAIGIVVVVVVVVVAVVSLEASALAVIVWLHAVLVGKVVVVVISVVVVVVVVVAAAAEASTLTVVIERIAPVHCIGDGCQVRNGA